MSYSRWSNSTWYTFWLSTGANCKDDEILSLWADLDQCSDWRYGNIKDWTVQDVCDAYQNITYEQAQEGWGYIQVWLDDVEKEWNRAVDGL